MNKKYLYDFLLRYGETYKQRWLTFIFNSGSELYGSHDDANKEEFYKELKELVKQSVEMVERSLEP